MIPPPPGQMAKYFLYRRDYETSARIVAIGKWQAQTIYEGAGWPFMEQAGAVEIVNIIHGAQRWPPAQ